LSLAAWWSRLWRWLPVISVSTSNHESGAADYSAYPAGCVRAYPGGLLEKILRMSNVDKARAAAQELYWAKRSNNIEYERLKAAVKDAIFSLCDGTYLKDRFDDGVRLPEMRGEEIEEFAEHVAMELNKIL
jgi:hypothetical protein